MRQRVMIAMALACKPKLLIADEPTTALDVTIQAQILELIKQLQDEEGMAVLFITHDMGVVAEIADRVVVMYRRRGGRDGRDRRDIFARAAHPYTRALLAAVPRLGSMDGTDAADALSDRRPGDRRAADVPTETPRHGRGAPSARCSRSPISTTRFDIRSRRCSAASRGRVHAVENVSLQPARRRDAGAGRRIRLRQVDDRPLDPAAGRSRQRHGPVRRRRMCCALDQHEPARARASACR